jgi:DNA-binding MarR family transcriptional regulator
LIPNYIAPNDQGQCPLSYREDLLMARPRLQASDTNASIVQATDELCLGPLGDWIGFHLRLAQSASFHAFARRLDQIDVSPGWFAVLALINENPGITQTALSRADTRDKSSLTPILDDLERRAMILRERLPSNRRSYSLRLTAAGVSLLNELMRHARAHEAELDRLAAPIGKSSLIEILQKISTAFTHDDFKTSAPKLGRT